MKNLLDVLKNCVIFKGLSINDIENILNNTNHTIYNQCKNCISCNSCLIHIEGDPCSSIGIVIDGIIEIQKQYINGKTVTLTSLHNSDIFGEALIFAKENKYPATISCRKNSKILYINKDDIINMCSKNTTILNNFMEILSYKILTLNKKVTLLSLENIREKICYFLMEQYKIQKRLDIKLPISKKSLAEYLGIQRPSLSRELLNMKNDNLISLDKNIIYIKNLTNIKSYLS